MGCTYPIRLIILLFYMFSAAMVATQAQNAVVPTPQRTYPDSAEGLQAQIGDIIGIARSSDQAAIRTALDSLSVPNADKWFGAHFDPRFRAQLPGDYANVLSAYRSEEHTSELQSHLNL